MFTLLNSLDINYYIIEELKIASGNADVTAVVAFHTCHFIQLSKGWLWKHRCSGIRPWVGLCYEENDPEPEEENINSPKGVIISETRSFCHSSLCIKYVVLVCVKENVMFCWMLVNVTIVYFLSLNKHFYHFLLCWQTSNNLCINLAKLVVFVREISLAMIKTNPFLSKTYFTTKCLFNITAL